jgi:hypothetical protein
MAQFLPQSLEKIMLSEQNKQQGGNGAVNIGNASNAGPNDQSLESGENNQLLNDKAEKYMRQVTSPEEMPDAEERQDIDE